MFHGRFLLMRLRQRRSSNPCFSIFCATFASSRSPDVCGNFEEGSAKSRDTAHLGSVSIGKPYRGRKCYLGAVRKAGGQAGHTPGSCTASHLARAAFTAAGFSWAIQCPDGTITSVRFRQSFRIGSARREATVSHV